MKTTKKDFEYFKERCLYWLDRFQLNNWEVNFKHEYIKGSQTQLTRSYSGCRATLWLSTEIDIFAKSAKKEIDDNAKHEVTHILCSNLSGLAHNRYISENEIDKTEEELVMKLLRIIK